MLHPFRVKILSPDERETYRAIYRDICGTYISDEYLHNQLVHGIFYKKRMVGGFIVGQQHPYRAINQFVPEERLPEVYGKLEGIKVGEVCAVWKDRNFKSKLLDNALWAYVAYYSMKTDSRIFLLGTFEAGLAVKYSYPKYGHLIYQGPYGDGKTYYIFIGFKEDGLKASAVFTWFNLKRKLNKLAGIKTQHTIKPMLDAEAVRRLIAKKN